VKSEYDVEEDFPVINCTPYGYPFEVWDHLTYHVSSTDLFDKNGNWVRTNWHKHGMDRVYNRSFPDHVATGPFNITCHVASYTGPLCQPTGPNSFCTIENCTGVDWNIQLPGAGTVFHASGLSKRVDYWPNGWDTEELVAELKRAGLDKCDVVALCSGLAP